MRVMMRVDYMREWCVCYSLQDDSKNKNVWLPGKHRIFWHKETLSVLKNMKLRESIISQQCMWDPLDSQKENNVKPMRNQLHISHYQHVRAAAITDCILFNSVHTVTHQMNGEWWMVNGVWHQMNIHTVTAHRHSSMSVSKLTITHQMNIHTVTVHTDILACRCHN